MLPTVSVILTVYKRTSFIRDAIQCAINQTFQSFEIIVTDDSSSDEIKEICESFNNSKIRYRTGSHNVGVALNVRTAIEESVGKYIAILNDDDCWEPDFLEKLVTPLEQNSNLVLAFSNHWVIDGNGEKLIQASEESTQDFGRADISEGILSNFENFVLKKNGVPLAMSAIFRKDVLNLDLLFKEVSGAYDFWISCMLASTGRPAYFVPEKLTRYRRHSEMESKRRAPDKKENLIFIYSELLNLNLFPNNGHYIRVYYSNVLRYSGVDQMMFNNLNIARNYILKSLRVYPNVRSVGALMVSFLPNKMRSLVLNYKAGLSC